MGNPPWINIDCCIGHLCADLESIPKPTSTSINNTTAKKKRRKIERQRKKEKKTKTKFATNTIWPWKEWNHFYMNRRHSQCEIIGIIKSIRFGIRKKPEKKKSALIFASAIFYNCKIFFIQDEGIRKKGLKFLHQISGIV